MPARFQTVTNVSGHSYGHSFYLLLTATGSASTDAEKSHLVKPKGAAHLLARRALKQGDFSQSLIAGYNLGGALSQLLVTQCSVGHMVAASCQSK